MAVWEIYRNIMKHPHISSQAETHLRQSALASACDFWCHRLAFHGMWNEGFTRIKSSPYAKSHLSEKCNESHIYHFADCFRMIYVFVCGFTQNRFLKVASVLHTSLKMSHDVSKSVNNHPQTNGCQIHKRKIGKREVPIKKSNPLRSRNSRSQDLPSQYRPIFLHAERIKKKLTRLNVTCAALTPARGTHQWCKICLMELAPFLRPDRTS